MDWNSSNILEVMHASYYQMSSAQRRLADYIFDNYTKIQFMSITELAGEAHTAEATVSRFCQSLDLKGFSALKIELAKHAVSNSQVLDVHGYPDETAQGRWRKALQLSIDAIQQTLDHANPLQYKQAVQLIENARSVVCIGLGRSSLVAGECAGIFAQATGKCYCISDYYAQFSNLFALDSDDILILFSYTGASQSGIKLLELARERRIDTILVTRFHKSPEAELASVVLRCGFHEAPFKIDSICEKVEQLAVIEMLYQEYYHRNKKRCDETLQQISSALPKAFP